MLKHFLSPSYPYPLLPLSDYDIQDIDSLVVGVMKVNIWAVQWVVKGRGLVGVGVIKQCMQTGGVQEVEWALEKIIQMDRDSREFWEIDGEKLIEEVADRYPQMYDR
jgi:hypothetical protein